MFVALLQTVEFFNLQGINSDRDFIILVAILFYYLTSVRSSISIGVSIECLPLADLSITTLSPLTWSTNITSYPCRTRG